MLKGRRKSDGRWATHSGGPRHVLKLRFFAVLAVLGAVESALAAPPGAIISNQATLEFEPSPGLAITIPIFLIGKPVSSKSLAMLDMVRE